MNTGEGEAVLRAADQEEIGRSVEVLRRAPSFVVLAGPSWLEDPARDALREGLGAGWTVEQRSVEDPDRIPRILVCVAEQPEQTVSWLALPADAEAARKARMALNLHREKLLRPGARSVLWLDGPQGFQQFLVAAPDAFSFRSRASVLQGERILPLPEGPEGESESLRAARAAVETARRAGRPREVGRRLVALGWELFDLGRTQEASRIGAGVLQSLGQERDVDRARALSLVVATGRHEDPVREHRLLSEALACLPERPSTEEEVRACLYVWSQLGGPPGLDSDLRSQLKASALLDGNRHLAFEKGAAVFGHLSQAYLCREDFPMAEASLRDYHELPLDDHGRATGLAMRARVEVARGALQQGVHLHEQASEAFARCGDRWMVSQSCIDKASVLLRMGEADIARRTLDAWVATQFAGQVLDVELAVRVADPEAAFRHLDVAWDPAHSAKSLETTRLRASATRAFVDAGLLPPSRLDDLDADLSRAETLVVAMAGDDPPWFPILFHQLRAERLAHRPARLQDAIALQTEALAWCTTDSEDLHPKAARLLGTWLLEAEDPRRALDILANAERIADEDHRHILGERARILGVATRAMVALGEDPAPAWAETRKAIDRTGSKIVEAEVLEDLGTHLPLDLPAPSPLDLLSQARTLYAAMPWPEREGRCLEALAERQVRQGRLPEAHRQLRRALNLYQAHHLRLCEMRAERRFAGLFDTPAGP